MFEVGWLTKAVAKLRSKAEVVVLDSAPIGAISDAITLARVSDIAIVVASPRRTQRNDASAAVQELRAVEPRSIVGVLNNVTRPLREGQARPSVPAAPDSPVPAARVPSVPGHHGAAAGTERATSNEARRPGARGQGPLPGWSEADDGPASSQDPE